ncbi:MAG TPA: hypothetical protein VK922_10830 [Gemmatimonadaceae bacterium]|nr:hypothetical protein [Gemmatimonadaceae bacterium]
MTKRTVLALFFLALAMRIGSVMILTERKPDLDAAEMEWIAVNLAEGRGFSSPFGPGKAPTAHLAPAVPYLWSAIFDWTGPATRTSVLIIRLLQTLPGAFAVLLYALCAERIRRRWDVLPRYAPVAVGLVMAFWPEALAQLSNTWYYQWQEAGLALLAYLGMVWIDRPRLASAAAAGLAAGMLALVNPTPAVVLGPILAAPLLRGWATARRHVVAAFVGGLVSLAVITPWMIRNRTVFGENIPIRGNLGLELLQANHPDARPMQYGKSYHPAVSREARAIFDSLGERGYAHWATQRAKMYIQADPVLAVKRTFVRVALFWTTDVFDRYRWLTDRPPWWKRCCSFDKLHRLATILCAVVPLGIVLGGLAAGTLRGLPYFAVFGGIFILMPLPFYLTIVGASYGMPVRSWLGVLAVLVVVASLARRHRLSPMREVSPAPW